MLGRTYAAKTLHPRAADQRHRRVLLLALRRRGLDRPVHHHLPHPLTGTRDPVNWITAQATAPGRGLRRRPAGARRWSAAATPLVTGRAQPRRRGHPRRQRRDDRQGQGALREELLELPRPGRRGHRGGPEPHRRRRGRGRLPGQHRPDARPSSPARRPAKPPAPDHRAADRTQLAAYIAVARRRPADPDRGPGQPRQARRGRAGAVPSRTAPQCHNFVGRGRRADLRQVRAAADTVHADRRSTRPCSPARRRCRSSTTPRSPRSRSGTSSPTSPRRAPSPTRAASAWAAIGPVTEGLVAWSVGHRLRSCLAAIWITAKQRGKMTR